MKYITAFFLCTTACGPAFTTQSPGEALDSGTSPQDDAEPAHWRVDVPDAAHEGTKDAEVAVDAVAAIDAAYDAAAHGDSGSVCASIGPLAECHGTLVSTDGAYYDNHTVTSVSGDQGCLIAATPHECRCAETYDCACIIKHATPSELCRFTGTTFQGCVVQSNGVPLVSCQ